MSLVDPKPVGAAIPEITLPEAAPSESSQQAPERPRIVALLNQKGGVGKTTSTVNLGAALARYGRRVLLVDLDPQSNLSLHFGVEPVEGQPTVHELLTDPAVQAADVLMRARTGLDFIPSVTELALVEGEMANRQDMQHVLRSKLEPVYANYDIILLDCPPSLGVLSVNALTVADEVFVPMQAHYLPLRGLEKLLQTVHLVSQGLNPRIKVTGVLLCMHEGQSSHSRAVIDEIESQLAHYRGTGLPWENAQVLTPPVRRNIKLAEAPSFGLTIFDYSPRCPGAEDYRRLAEALLVRWGASPTQFDARRPRRKREGAGESDQQEQGERRATRRRRQTGKGKRAVKSTEGRKTGAKSKTKTGTKSGTKSKPKSKPNSKVTVEHKARVKTRVKLRAKLRVKAQANVQPKRRTKLKLKITSAPKLAPKPAPKTSSMRPARAPAKKHRRTSRALRSGGLSL